MTKRTDLNPDVLEVLWDQYCRAIKYQRVNNDITVQMTFDEFLGLWSRSRIGTITSKLAIGQKTLAAYLTGPFRPVCSWVCREAMVRGGTMTAQDAKIRTADESRKLFRFQAGDQHSPASKARIGASKAGKKQTPEQIAKRTAARVATMAAKRAERMGGAA
ncbi:hypothetical protein [Sphingomonas sp. G-3-2-10]|uniref:hypothetical protein n=1 Tax=Sphingomonas sp. G-3-2-10 TaxID=2728838 RepID=UPI001469E1B5|nr:hypothetical protein [Sphingomonas sp. G-3-2-10]NML04253.1 hypothetical protein [Sphingomonas sp. G-3-2-10]